MEDMQHARVAEGSATEQADEARERTTSGVPTARLLANPRRIRRN